MRKSGGRIHGLAGPCAAGGVPRGRSALAPSQQREQSATYAPTDIASSAFSTLRSTIDLDLDDVRIGVVGDSTGAGESGTPRWVWLFAQKLAALHPTKTVTFHPWDVATNAYLAPITVQTGTAARMITIYNGSALGRIRHTHRPIS